MKPILFNTEMVNAILDGRKTVTRRVIKPQPSQNTLIGYCQDENIFGWSISKECVLITDSRTPPYQVGDILYVRETWQTWYDESVDVMKYCYYEDMIRRNVVFTEEEDEPIKWKPSIHMPKEAARIFLKVTDVRVEQLKEITQEDAENEGLLRRVISGNEYSPRIQFIDLWNSTVKDDRYKWDVNPWVWVIEFEKIDKPE